MCQSIRKRSASTMKIRYGPNHIRNQSGALICQQWEQNHQ